ncbi:DUF2529 domain-containing protein [Bacillus thermotolerans]|uniref:DUF2529 domain-containing protein n=1 Tax=Bacillus thermotolerans TaxID=1221996 RepID=UPI00058907ED|nr:DUF2529 domain-containing protein [Bacillus thermotolerans]KKB44904.1 hypothetical protein QY96_00028 [Bacillus thermotolerans]
MLKMFTTQLHGLFQRIADKESFSIEDGARLLTQAIVGEGTIYIQTFNEMDAVAAEATSGAEKLTSSQTYTVNTPVTESDRVLLISRFANDPEALEAAASWREADIPFVAIAGSLPKEENRLAELADVFIDTHLVNGLLPDDTGGRTGFPSSLAALYIYFALKLTIDEILEDQEI